MISPTSPPNIKIDNTSDTQNEEENNFKAEVIYKIIIINI